MYYTRRCTPSVKLKLFTIGDHGKNSRAENLITDRNFQYTGIYLPYNCNKFDRHVRVMRFYFLFFNFIT